MYSGKTTTGIALAKELNYTFLDIDLRIEELYKMTIEDIFASFGEDRFRLWEREVLLDFLQRKDDVVISLGGGTPCFFDNMRLCKESGVSVFLDVPSEVILRRSKAADVKRPIIQNVSNESLPSVIEKFLAQRKPYYLQADIIYPSADLDVRQLALTIAEYANNSANPYFFLR